MGFSQYQGPGLMKANSITPFLVFLVMTLFVTEFAFAYSKTGGFPSVFQGNGFTQPRQILHTVEKNESLWHIAKRFDVDFTKLAEINGLENPDLIFPGNKLIIKIQFDGSILVVNKEDPVKNVMPFDFTPREAVAHVVYPDKDDVFAPENPTVSYEIPESISKQQRKTSKQPLVFKSFANFLRWFSAQLGYPSDMTQARGQASFDPPTSPTYLSSGSLFANALLGSEDEISTEPDYFSSHITGTLSPPPKSL